MELHSDFYPIETRNSVLTVHLANPITAATAAAAAFHLRLLHRSCWFVALADDTVWNARVFEPMQTNNAMI